MQVTIWLIASFWMGLALGSIACTNLRGHRVRMLVAITQAHDKG